MPRKTRVHLRRFQAADQRGVALVEFALVLPLILLLLAGLIDVGKAFNYWNDETHLSNEAARYAAVNNSPDPNWASDKTNPNYKINTVIRNQADSGELKTGSNSVSPPGIKVCIWFPNGTHNVGDPLQVIVHAQYNWLGYLVGRWRINPHSDLTGSATMRLEKTYNADGTDAFWTGPDFPLSARKTDASGTC